MCVCVCVCVCVIKIEEETFFIKALSRESDNWFGWMYIRHLNACTHCLAYVDGGLELQALRQVD